MLITTVLRTASLLVVLAALAAAVMAAPSADELWQSVTTNDNSRPTARHEAGAAVADGRIYLFGGRGMRPVERYDSGSGRWQNVANSPLVDGEPLEMHHMQPVAIGNLIYIVAAFTCCYPAEPTISEIYVYDTTTNTWSIRGEIPVERRRGSAGVVVHNNKIYLVGGNTNGHSGGAVPWFDEYDPSTGDWKTLPDAPNARDHFQAAIVGNRLVAAAGRKTTLPNPFDNAVSGTDVYDFGTGKWSSQPAVPTVRAGTISVSIDSEVLVLGGEIDTTSVAYDRVEAFNVNTNSWRILKPMITGRHSGGGVRLGDRLHMMAGSQNAGGGPETSTHESLNLAPVTNPDRDGDGLSNEDEIARGTDPDRADTDGDRLSDAEEVSLGTNPLQRDTDGDELDDNVEVNQHSTDPRLSDTDGDNATDAQEINDLKSNPLVRDTDGDGLIDGSERILGTSAILTDTDEDTLSDGDEVNVHGTSPLLTDTDEDELRDDDELTRGTDPLRADSDGDGRKDGDEIRDGTDPLVVPVIDNGGDTSAAGGDASGTDSGKTGSGEGSASTGGVSNGEDTELTGADTGSAPDEGDGTSGSDTQEPVVPSASSGSGGGSTSLLILCIIGCVLNRCKTIKI